MFYKLTLKNEAGQIVDINDGKNYQVLSCKGLTPPTAELFLSKSPNRKGAKFNGSVLNERTIEIDIKMLGDVEQSRNALYSWASPEEKLRINYSNTLKNVYCEGNVESASVELFNDNQVMTLVIVCGDPYLKNVNTIVQEITKYEYRFKFPFAIDKNGEAFSTIKDRIATSFNYNGVSGGFEIQIIFHGTVNGITIVNLKNGSYFTLNKQFIMGDAISINSLSTPKKVVNKTTGENLLKYMSPGSEWLKLSTGENMFQVEPVVDSDKIECRFILEERFLGV